MESLAYPELLPLLLALPFLAAWLRRPPAQAIAFPNVESLKALPRGRADFVRRADLLLKLLIFALFIFAAVSPRTPDLKTRLPREGIAIAIVLDVSGSMATPDFNGTRLDAAKSAFARFIAERGDDSIALTTFAAWPRTECPPTLNHTVLAKIVNDVTVRSGIDAGTNIGDALAEGLMRLQTSPAKRKVIVLLTDGEHNAAGSDGDNPLTPRQAAQLAANLQVPVYAIDCGGDPEKAATGEEQQQRRDGRALLQQVADLTGGKFFAADDASQLDATMQSLNELERQPVASFQYRRFRDYDRVLGGIAFGLLLVSVLLNATLWRRWPA